MSCPPPLSCLPPSRHLLLFKKTKKFKEKSPYPLTHELNLFIFGSFGWKTLQQNHWGGSSILVRAPACHAGGCEFKPRLSRDKDLSKERSFRFFFSVHPSSEVGEPCKGICYWVLHIWISSIDSNSFFKPQFIKEKISFFLRITLFFGWQRHEYLYIWLVNLRS